VTASGEESAARGPAEGGRRLRCFHRCSCGRVIPEGVRRCSSRTCPEYAPTWARDTRRRLLENLRPVRLSVMFSVTAPGRDVLPFDPRLCSHTANVRCGGPIGCRVYREAADAFNHKAGEWWSQLHRVAKTRADRATGMKGKLLVRVWEKQKRGVAHLHGVVSVATPAERVWAKAYVTALDELAPRYGFGFVDGWDKISRKFWPGDQAGAYLSSYFVSGRGKKASITENVLDPNLPRLVVFVGRDLTRATGCTMRNLRLARRLWASREGLIEKPDFTYDEWLAAAAMLSRRPATRAP
jgi:hypothetical protein